MLRSEAEREDPGVYFYLIRREPFGRGLLRVPLPVPLALTQTRAPEDRDNEIETTAVADDIVRDIANFVNLKVTEVSPKTTTTTTTTPL